jgi:galactosylgalactosylxylosylprotein 3-beta-glucuronosyltransferase 3
MLDLLSTPGGGAAVEQQQQPTMAQQQRVLYIVTPTNARPSQMVDMVRLKQTLQLASLVKHRYIYWIVIEDAAAPAATAATTSGTSCTRRIRNLLLDSGLDFAHVAQTTSVPDNSSNKNHHRGVDQRNRALDIIEHEVGLEGVVYFADDDNAYDIQLFAELPATLQLSMFSVGFRGASRYQGFHVDPQQTGRIDRIDTNLDLGRKYPVDMAGFAFSTAVLLEKHVRFDPAWPRGHLESAMVESIVGGDNLSEIEPLAGGCVKMGGIVVDQLDQKPNDVSAAAAAHLESKSPHECIVAFQDQFKEAVISTL